MIIKGFLVGLPAMLVCLAIQAYVAFWCVRYYVRRVRSGEHMHAGIGPLLVAMVAILTTMSQNEWLAIAVSLVVLVLVYWALHALRRSALPPAP